jgi:hypothetical protein
LQHLHFPDIQIRINPGELPIGSCFTAMEKSEASHRFPLPPNCPGESDYLKILDTMIKFLHPLEKLPIFFTEGNTRDNKVPLSETCKIVDKIFYESQEDDVMQSLKIYPLDELLFVMQRLTSMKKKRMNKSFDQPFPSVSYAADRLKADSYLDTTKGCRFHDDEGKMKTAGAVFGSKDSQTFFFTV